VKLRYLEGLVPATVTPFTDDGAVDLDQLEMYCRWLVSIRGVSALLLNGHAGEGTHLTSSERSRCIEVAKLAAGGKAKIIASVGGDGTRLVVDEAVCARESGADAVLVFPAPSWLRFGYQAGSARERYEAVSSTAGLPILLFQFPAETRAAYDLATILDLCAIDGVVGIKDGGRNMVRWDTDVPVIRQHFPDVAILTCQDEFLLHTMWECDGALVGYGALIPELLVELLGAAKEHRYDEAKRIYDTIAPLTRVIYHRTSHIEATAAMKIGLVHRGVLKNAVVRPPLMALEPAASKEISDALAFAGLRGLT
jgi:4-hydroxy-tetrahydrodipicolinate synthase